MQYEIFCQQTISQENFILRSTKPYYFFQSSADFWWISTTQQRQKQFQDRTVYIRTRNIEESLQCPCASTRLSSICLRGCSRHLWSLWRRTLSKHGIWICQRELVVNSSFETENVWFMRSQRWFFTAHRGFTFPRAPGAFACVFAAAPARTN